MAFISVAEANETGNRLSFEFLQLPGLIRIELRRGLTLGTFPYASISRANADKKALKVLSLFAGCLLPGFLRLHHALSVVLDGNAHGFRPRPGRVSRPLTLSASKRFTQELTDICVISVCTPTSWEVRPLAFSSIVRQRIRKAWLLPWRKPSSSCRRCVSVSCITLIFAIVVCVFAFNAQYYAKN